MDAKASKQKIELPKISIITPVLNRVEMIEQTVQSVLSQHYPNLEYIVMDGGSTDGTLEVLEQYQDRCTIISEKDKGMYDAIMKGMQRATGEIVTWLNSDDIYHPNALWIVGELFAQLPQVRWLTGVPTLYNAEGKCVKVFNQVFWSWERFKAGDFYWIQQESTFFRRELFDKVGGLNTDYRLAADFELWCKMFQETKLYSVNTILGGFRQHGNQLSLEQGDKYGTEVSKIAHQYHLRLRASKLQHYLTRLHIIKYPCYGVSYEFEAHLWKEQ